MEISTIETIKELIKQHHQYEQEPENKSDKDSQISDINDEDLKIIENIKNTDYLSHLDTNMYNIDKKLLLKYCTVGDIMFKFKTNLLNTVEDAINNVKKELLNWRLNNEMSMNQITVPITYYILQLVNYKPGEEREYYEDEERKVLVDEINENVKLFREFLIEFKEDIIAKMMMAV